MRVGDCWLVKYADCIEGSSSMVGSTVISLLSLLSLLLLLLLLLALDVKVESLGDVCIIDSGTRYMSLFVMSKSGGNEWRREN